MQKPDRPWGWIFAGIVLLLSVLLAARGALTLASGTYEGTAKYSGPFVLHGLAASMMGAANVFAGVFIASVLAAYLKVSRRIYIALGVAGGLGAVMCFVGSFLAQ